MPAELPETDADAFAATCICGITKETDELYTGALLIALAATVICGMVTDTAAE